MTALESALAAFPTFKRALLIGSDDGALLSRLAAHAGHLTVTAQDYASSEAIRVAAADSRLVNVHILAQELRLLAPTEKYDLICGVDATSLIADEVAFLYIIEKLRLMTRPGGTLLLTEVLSTRHDPQQSAELEGCRKFRSVEDFRTVILRKGFVLKSEALISEAQDKHLVNKLFIFELANDHGAQPGRA